MSDHCLSSVFLKKNPNTSSQQKTSLGLGQSAVRHFHSLAAFPGVILYHTHIYEAYRKTYY